MFDHRVPTTYVRMLLQASDQAMDTLLAGTDLNEEYLRTHDYLLFEQVGLITKNLSNNEPEADWALRLGQILGVSAHGSLGFAALSAPTLAEGLDVFVRFVVIRAPYVRFEAAEYNGRYLLTIHDNVAIHGVRIHFHEMIVMVVQAYVEQLLGHKMTEGLYSFSYLAPDYADKYVKQVSGKYSFDPDNPTTISLPLSWASLASPLANESMYRSALLECHEQLAQTTPLNDIVSRVSNKLEAHFSRALAGQICDLPPPQVEELAMQLNMAPRTLIRKLKNEGSSYRELLEICQKHAATSLLAGAKYTVADIASILGYRDAANFSRAFRRWFGTTPAVYRRQL